MKKLKMMSVAVMLVMSVFLLTACSGTDQFLDVPSGTIPNGTYEIVELYVDGESMDLGSATTSIIILGNTIGLKMSFGLDPLWHLYHVDAYGLLTLITLDDSESQSHVFTYNNGRITWSTVGSVTSSRVIVLELVK